MPVIRLRRRTLFARFMRLPRHYSTLRSLGRLNRRTAFLLALSALRT